MLDHAPTSCAREPASPELRDGMGLCGYFPHEAHMVDVAPGASRRRARDPRIDLVGMHLATVHSMPLHRVAELVAREIARRARHGTSARRHAHDTRAR
jgi:hypothetical protein